MSEQPAIPAIDGNDAWVIQRHLELKQNQFWGKVILSYEKGQVVNRKIEVNEKPVKV